MSDLEKRWEELFSEVEKTVEYKQESIAIDIGVNVHDRLRELGLKRADLAKKMSVSRSYVSQILGGKPNMTLATIVKLADALRMELQIRLVSRRTPSILLFPNRGVHSAASTEPLSGGANNTAFPLPASVEA